MKQVRVKTLDDAMRILKSPHYHHAPQVVATLMTGLEEERPVLSVADGETWQRTHDALVRFFTPAYVETYMPAITRITDETFATIHDSVNLETCMRELTTRVMWHVLFKEMMPPATAEMVARETGIISSSRNYAEQREAVHTVSRFLRETIKRPLNSPLLDSLMDRFIYLEPEERTKVLISELKFLIIAGVETTAASLVFTICEIAQAGAVTR